MSERARKNYPPRVRVFFAIWPPPAVAAEIGRYAEARGLPGRPVPVDRLHLTLAFHGGCTPSAITQLRARAKDIDADAFTLVLNRLGCFAGAAAAAWVGPARVPHALSALAADLAPEVRSGVDKPAFCPHITLRRQSPPIAFETITPISLSVTSFALVASGRAGSPGVYETLASWPLRRVYPAAPGMKQ